MPTRDEKNNFSIIIITLAEKNRVGCLDTIVTYCEGIGLEMEVAATLVNDILKARLHDEAMDLNYIEKSSKLPL
jgi:hypothetical protein